MVTTAKVSSSDKTLRLCPGIFQNEKFRLPCISLPLMGNGIFATASAIPSNSFIKKELSRRTQRHEEIKKNKGKA
jgi:hypothetical protein